MTPRSGRPAFRISRQLPEPAVELARSRAEIDAYAVDAAMPRAELLARLRDKQGLICVISEAIDQALLDACPDLRVGSTAAVGHNNADCAACTSRGGVAPHHPDRAARATADLPWAS